MADGRSANDTSAETRLAKRVLLVGWDGAEPATLRLLLEAGRLPHLRSLVERGVTLQLAVPRPTFTQAAWTSLATGKRPHEHGVLHAFRQTGIGSDLRPVSRDDRECGAFWNTLHHAGLRTHVVGWPVTHPAESIAGISVSDRFAANLSASSRVPWEKSTVAPPELERILIERGMSPHQVEDLTLGQLLHSRFIGLRDYARVESICRDVLAQAATLFRAVRWCLDAQAWDFAACVFPGIRRIQELASWLRGLSPNGAELSETLVAGCYEHHDLLLGQLLSQTDDTTHVVVVSAIGSAAATTSEYQDRYSMWDSVVRKSGLAVIAGPRVIHRAAVEARSLLALAPTILSMLDVSYEADMECRPLDDLFDGGLVMKTSTAREFWLPDDKYRHKRELTARTNDACNDRTGIEELEYLYQLGYTDPFDEIARQKAIDCHRTSTLNRAISLMDAGLLDQATAFLEQLKQLHPDWLPSRSLLAETYYRAGQKTAAREEIEWLTCHGFENPTLYLLLATIECADRRFDHALESLYCAGRGDTFPRGSFLLAGQIQLRRLNYSEAAKAFHHSLEFDGMTAAALDGLASVKLQLGEYEQAAVYALDALESDMRLSKAHYHLAVALYFLDKPREALQALRSWMAVEPHAAAPYRWMARIYRRLTDLPQSENVLQRGREVIRLRHRSQKPV